jgi:RNA polymerase sigma-70 factor (ECF subfamily)
MTDRSLVEAAQADPRRFADLYELHFDRVYAYTARRLRDRAAAQDVVADVFHHALANLQNYEWRGIPFLAWLLRIASNKIYDYRQRQHQERSLPTVVEEAAEPDYTWLEASAKLFVAVRQLPEDQRRVIELRFSEQKSIRETADTMQRSEGAVKQLQLRAVEALRVHLGEVDHA